jgi:hypothetical protein
MRYQLLTMLLFLSIPSVALADGIEIPKKVNRTVGGNFVIRAVVSTTNDVSNLQYGLYKVNNGSIGEELKDVVKRPEFMSTTAGQKRPILFNFNVENKLSNQLAVCMYSPSPKPTEVKSSQLISNFRYCKLFTIEN